MFSFHRLFGLGIAALPWPSAGATHATATNAAELAFALSRDPVGEHYLSPEVAGTKTHRVFVGQSK